MTHFYDRYRGLFSEDLNYRHPAAKEYSSIGYEGQGSQAMRANDPYFPSRFSPTSLVQDGHSI